MSPFRIDMPDIYILFVCEYPNVNIRFLKWEVQKMKAIDELNPFLGWRNGRMV